MFSGIIDSVGKLKDKNLNKTGALSLTIRSPYKSLKLGESIAIEGVCLTVVQTKKTGSGTVFKVDVSNETIRKTTLNDLSIGCSINLERALKLSDRLGGHFVLGHVDSKCTLLQKKMEPNGTLYTFSYPKSFARAIVERGSVALDGISLTVAKMEGNRTFTTAIVPYTEKHTSLGEKKVGSQLNLEVDMLAKIAAKQYSRKH